MFEMITYSIKSLMQPFVIATLGTVSGISFMLINVRVALGWSEALLTTLNTTVGASHPAFAPRSTEVHIPPTVNLKDDDGSTQYELDVRKHEGFSV